MTESSSGSPGGSIDEALVAALIELEHHVAESGWDQPPRLFALVRTDELIAAEPQLAQQQGLRGSAQGGHPDALTAIEQDQFDPGADVVGELVDIVWPETVLGCALSMESSFLPAGAEVGVPEDPSAAARFVADHPLRQDIRVVIGVTRDGSQHGVGRLVSQPDELLGAADLVPGLGTVLAHTLAGPETGLDPETAAG